MNNWRSEKKNACPNSGFLPVIVILAGVALYRLHIPFDFNLPAAPTANDVRNIIWNLRHLDLLGQIVILLAGAFGVVALFKEYGNG